MKKLTKHMVSVAVAGLALLILPACAGHKELKAPCSASFAPASFWTGSAYASGGCGLMLDINVVTPPATANVGT